MQIFKGFYLFTAITDRVFTLRSNLKTSEPQIKLFFDYLKYKADNLIFFFVFVIYIVTFMPFYNISA